MRGVVLLVLLGLTVWLARGWVSQYLDDRHQTLSAEIDRLDLALRHATARLESLELEADPAEGRQFFGIEARSHGEAVQALEDLVIETVQAAGFELQSFRPIAEISGVAGMGVGFELEASGAYPDLLRVLDTLENERPVVASRTLWIRSGGSFSDSELETAVQFRGQFWTLVQVPGEGAD